ncbi:MAG: aminopeptidase [Dethiosulfovibrio peptidovorans]|nr:MAG: aminopeptidase [Dethiosulfovibrio peptidovorans]
MNVEVFSGDAPVVPAVAVLYYEGQDMSKIWGGAAETAARHFGAIGRKNEWFRFPSLDGGAEVFLVGLGKKKDVPTGAVRDGVAETVRRLGALGIAQAAVIFPDGLDEDLSAAAAEGAVLGNYRFDRFRTPKEGDRTVPMESLFLMGGHQSAVDRGVILGRAQTEARDLANRPGNDITPQTLAERAQKIAEETGLECEIWDETKIQAEGMSALWHVGKGSQTPPRFIHMIYRPKERAKKKVVFVGKGITFDSGGLCIKNRVGIRTMKCDKTGGCNVLAIMKAVAALTPDIEVHGVVGAAENMPDGAAYRPDDIVRAKNGKTIEIVNTDAEGRVTLADSLSFASELQPDVIVDMATLTGAAVTALGNYTAGLLCDHDDLSRAIMDAGCRAGERFHHFTMDDDKLREQIDSPVADLLNSGGPGGGMITAGMFLKEFVNPDIPWAHLDIAAVDFYEKPFGCYGKGASAFGVRTCLEYIRSL